MTGPEARSSRRDGGEPAGERAGVGVVEAPGKITSTGGKRSMCLRSAADTSGTTASDSPTIVWTSKAGWLRAARWG